MYCVVDAVANTRSSALPGSFGTPRAELLCCAVHASPTHCCFECGLPLFLRLPSVPSSPSPADSLRFSKGLEQIMPNASTAVDLDDDDGTSDPHNPGGAADSSDELESPRMVIELGGRKYHPQCLRCKQCHKALSLSTALVRTGDLFCDSDYQSLFMPTCSRSVLAHARFLVRCLLVACTPLANAFFFCLLCQVR